MFAIRNLSSDEWKELVDFQGPHMEFEVLRKLVYEAPDEVRDSPEWRYLQGLYDGRIIEREMGNEDS